MKNYLIIKANINSSIIENYFTELSKSGSSVNLVLPSNLKLNLLGNKIALTQFINTWIRKSKYGKLYLYDTKDYLEQQLQGFATNSIHSIVAIMMSEEKGIFGYNSKKILTEKAMKYCEEEVIKLKGPINSINKIGDEYYQIHFDHKGKQFWFTDDFYLYNNHEGKYKSNSKNDFHKPAQTIAEKCTPKKIKNIGKLSETITPLLYELFDNTINWASTINDIGNTIPNNRVIYFRFMNHTLKQVEDSIRGISSIEQYLKSTPNIIHESIDPRSKKTIKYAFFMELSILDSGRGLASQFGEKDFKTENNLLEEYNAVITSFEKHKTSITGYTSQTRGMGLFNVLSTLNNIAFLKIRTGHLSLYRDFIKNPFNKDNDDTTLFDISDKECISTEAKSKVKNYAWAEGTLFTILLPLNLI